MAKNIFIIILDPSESQPCSSLFLPDNKRRLTFADELQREREAGASCAAACNPHKGCPVLCEKRLYAMPSLLSFSPTLWEQGTERREGRGFGLGFLLRPLRSWSADISVVSFSSKPLTFPSAAEHFGPRIGIQADGTGAQ